MFIMRLLKNLTCRRAGAIALKASALASLLLMGASCSTTPKTTMHMVVSVPDQRMVLMDKGVPVKSYPVSTSKFGLGDRPGSNYTPLGRMRVYSKIGDNAKPGTVFKGRRPTGEVVKPNSPGRDPIVSRILWLEGTQRCNAGAKNRYIYIHGTPEERNIGRPASYGCIRMKSKDVIDLYKRVARGATVDVKPSHLALRELPGSDRAMIAEAKRREEMQQNRPGPAEIMAAASPSTRSPLGSGSAGETRVVAQKIE